MNIWSSRSSGKICAKSSTGCCRRMAQRAGRRSTCRNFVPPSTRLKFWGVRGSIPVPGASTVRYGGNTSCIELRAEGEIIILDAGSGMRLLGNALEEEFGSEADQAHAAHHAHSLGPHPGASFFPARLQGEEQPPRSRLRRRAQRSRRDSRRARWRLRFSRSACATCRARSRSRS